MKENLKKNPDILRKNLYKFKKLKTKHQERTN